MPSTTDYKDYILDQLQDLPITYKPMMGEYLLYYHTTLFGGIYDDRLLIKITNTNAKYNLSKELPYAGAKPMYMVDNVEDREHLYSIIIDTYKGLTNKNKKDL